MKRALAFLMVLVMGLSLLCGCGTQTDTNQGTGDNAGDEAVVLKLGVTTNQTAVHYTSSAAFGEELQKVSGGKMSLQIISDGALGTVAQHFAQLKAGTLDCFVTGVSDAEILQGGNDFGVMCTPFLFTSQDHYEKFIDSDVFANMMGKVEDANGVKFVGETCMNFPRGLNTKMPVYALNDMKGVKIRVSNNPIYLTAWDVLGATPVTVDGSPYMAVEQGLADAQENDIVLSISIGCTEVCPYYMQTEYVYQSLGLYMSQTTWNQLSDTQRGWISEALAASKDAFTAQLFASMDETVAKAEAEGGLTVIPKEEIDIESFRVPIAENIERIAEAEGFDVTLYDQIKNLAE